MSTGQHKFPGCTNMICDIGEDSFRKAHMYDTLCSDKDASLYKACIKRKNIREERLDDNRQVVP